VKRKTLIQGKSCDDEGKDWRDASTSQQTPDIALPAKYDKLGGRPRTDPSLASSEGARPC